MSFTATIASFDYIPSIGFCRAHYFATKIQRLVKRKDLNGLAKLIDEETRPELREELLNRPFEESFDDQTISNIINAGDFCWAAFQGRPHDRPDSIGGIWYKKINGSWQIIAINFDAPRPKSKFPDGWVYNGKSLHPKCFITGFKWGAYDISLDECLSKTGDSDGNYYQVLKEISIPMCEKLARRIHKEDHNPVDKVDGKCLKSYLIRSTGTGGSLTPSARTIYGLFEMDDGSKQIIPLKIRE